MANTKISALPNASTLGGSEQIPAVQSGGDVKLTPAQISAYINPMTTTGDLIVGGSGGALSRLGIGTTNYVLTVVSGAPAWAAATGGFTNPMTTAGDLIIGGTSGAATRLAAGTNTQVLTMVSGAPAWAAASGGSSTLTIGTTQTSGATAGQLLYSDGTYVQAGGGTLIGNALALGGATIGSNALAVTGTTLFGGQANFGTQALTYGATVNWNLNTQQTASLTLTGNPTIANPTNLVNGGQYTLLLVQDGTGSRSVTWGTNYKWLNTGGSAPALSQAPNAVDVASFISDGTYMYGAIGTASGASAGGDLSGSYPNPTVASIGGKAISLAGALTTSGAFGVTFTFSGITGVTFPTSGTLATNAAYSGGSGVGLVPSGGTGATYLRGDGTWSTPSGGSLTIGGSSIASSTVGDVLVVGASNLLQQVANIPLSNAQTQYLSDNFGAF